MCMLVGAFLRGVLCEQCVGSCVSRISEHTCVPFTTCVRTAMYVHVGSGCVEGVFTVCVCGAAVCAHGYVRAKRIGDAMMGRSLNKKVGVMA